ncbi:related to multidrug resistance protein [Cephalotrichum gorgonifer]|uniref:Related to multidrug resistance protein n=1 Tax=Cephalotrichum gorgonifer TaxID=2041049 RepID=A0AAE8N429_9PEZI|nr:related to multidrug resistance protein [Cephalotrichum gorgonifer]
MSATEAQGNEKPADAVVASSPEPETAAPKAELKSWTRFFSFFQLLVYANPTWLDYLLLLVGTLAAMASGVPFPIMGILFGQLLDDMNASSCDSEAVGDPTGALQSEVNSKVLILVYLAIAAFVLIYTYILSWNLMSQRLAQRLREKYFSSILAQDAAFFDTRKAGEVSSRLNADIQLIQTGTSEKVGMYIATISFFIAAYGVAFSRDAQLAGMLISIAPAFLAMGLVGGYYIQKFSALLSTAIGSASAVASEALTHVSVVQAFGAAPRLEARFAGFMMAAQKAGVKKAMAAAVQAGALYFIAFSANALAFWQGSTKIAKLVGGEKGGATIGQIYTVVFLIVDACVLLSQVAPFLGLFSAASAAFVSLRDDISHKPTIDGTSTEGLRPNSSAGSIELKNVDFAYPSRPDAPTLKNVSISIPTGKHTAVVGPSGGGKSTIVALIMRLYDPVAGEILLDGVPLKNYNVRYVRSLIGMVQQEPTLLNRSLLENIALGLVNSANPAHDNLQSTLLGPELSKLAAEVKDGKDMVAASASYSAGVQTIVRLVAEAADTADATPFIKKLQFGFATPVGTGGTQISGGQRQRIALARALIRDPKILILDEATASLDSATERRIQANLERIAKGRAVLSVAHRLSTIKDADNIMVFKAGMVVEQGKHAELMALNGNYSDLVKLQSIHKDEDEDASTTRSNSVELVKGQLEGVADEKAPVAVAEGEAAESVASEAGGFLDKPMSGGVVVKKIGHFVRPNVSPLLAGAIAAVVVGCTYSALGVIFGTSVGILNPCTEVSVLLSKGKLLSGMFFMLAVVELLANFFSWSCFGFVAEKLLYRLRVLSFRSLFKQGMDFHQSEGQSPATLLSVITKDTAELGGFSGSVMGTLLAVTVNLLVAIILSHILAWKIAIVCLVLIPIQFGSGILQMMALARHQRRHADAFAQAVGITVEAVNAIKTVSTLSLEEEVFRTYRRTLNGPRKAMVVASAYVNLWLAISYSVGNIIYAFAYWWGAKLIIKGEYTSTQFFIILIAMLVGAQLWGQMFALAPEITRARLAASRILNLVDMGNGAEGPAGKPPLPDIEAKKEKDAEAAVDATVPTGSPVASRQGGTKISFKNVTFSYPARPELTILQNVSFDLEPGKFYGLVGPSGAGKSTIMSLVQGMYAATTGSVTLDGVDVGRAGGASSFRDEISIVPQDSALFDGTVAFNLGLGAKPGHEATQEEMEAACKIANMHDVIMALPQGYQTEIGPNGSRLSGGQRQRLAIARALVRKPRLLLLDESTSALDAENEKALQEGLERAAKGVTVLAITHRIHTVRSADVILVVDGGRVVDMGSHEDLMYELGDYAEIKARRDRIDREKQHQAKRAEKTQWLDERDEMKFSHSIQFNAVPDWSSEYLAYSNLKKLIYQLEKTVHDAAAGDAESRPLVGVQDPEDIFQRALSAELDKITAFYKTKEEELFDDAKRLMQEVDDFEGVVDADGRPRWYPAHDTDNTENSDDDDDETTGLTRRHLNRRKSSINALASDMTASAEIFPTRSARRGSTNTVDYAEQSFLYSTGIVLKKRVTALFVQLCELKSYIQLNKTGFGKVLKKFDKILNKEMKARYMDDHVLPAYPFRPETLSALEEKIKEMESAYAAIATQGDMDLAKKDLRSHLREHVVWERNTVWRDMIGLERRAEAARIGTSILGTENAATLLQGDEAKVPQSAEVETPFGLLKVPLWLTNSAMLTLIAAVVIFLIILWVPIMEKAEQQNCLALLVFVSLLWATEAIPLFVTSLTIPFLCVVLRVVHSDFETERRLDAKEAAKYIFSAMWTPVIMLLLGGFTLAAALSKCRIDKHLATFVLSKAGTQPRAVILANMFVAAFASMLISNVAAPVLCFSIIEPMLRTLPSDSNMSKAVIMGIALASNIGGMLSPIASPQNVVAMGIMSPPPSWPQWFLIVMPVGIISLILIWLLLLVTFHPGRGTTIAPIRSMNESFTGVQWFVSLVTIFTIGLWCASKSLESVFGDMGVIAVIPMALFFGIGILTKEDFNNFPWTIIILAAGGLSLGKAVDSSGLLHTVGGMVTARLEGMSLYGILVTFSALILVIATFISHTVAALIILPLLSSVGKGMETPSPNILVMAGVLMCSAAMGLPTSGFPNMTAIMKEDAAGRRYLNVNHFISRGVPSSILTLIVSVTIGYVVMLVAGLD